MITSTCARCGGTLAVGDLAVDVRKVTNVWEDDTVTHDRGDALAHLVCPTTTGPTTEAGWRQAIELPLTWPNGSAPVSGDGDD